MVPLAILHTIDKRSKASYKRKGATKRQSIGEMCNNTGKPEHRGKKTSVEKVYLDISTLNIHQKNQNHITYSEIDLTATHNKIQKCVLLHNLKKNTHRKTNNIFLNSRK